VRRKTLALLNQAPPFLFQFESGHVRKIREQTGKTACAVQGTDDVPIRYGGGVGVLVFLHSWTRVKDSAFHLLAELAPTGSTRTL